jgi:hypothetical protein
MGAKEGESICVDLNSLGGLGVLGGNLLLQSKFENPKSKIGQRLTYRLLMLIVSAFASRLANPATGRYEHW